MHSFTNSKHSLAMLRMHREPIIAGVGGGSGGNPPKIKPLSELFFKNENDNLFEKHGVKFLNLTLSGVNQHNSLIEEELQYYSLEEQKALVLNFDYLSLKYKDKYKI